MVKKSGLPEWGEFVLCTVTRITPYAAWCRLDEYLDKIEGMIHVSEVSGRWVHDIREFVKLNKQYVAKVVKVDYQKNSVNLSLKRVSKFDEREKMNAFRREQRGERMLEQAGKELGKNLEQSYGEVGFLLQKNFGELFAAFEEIKKSPDALTNTGVSQQWLDALKNVAEKTFKEKEIVIKADLELKSYAKDGVKKIKDVLKNLSEKTGASVKYISAPKYRVEITTKDPKATEKKLKEGLEETVKQIESLDGEGSYKMVK